VKIIHFIPIKIKRLYWAMIVWSTLIDLYGKFDEAEEQSRAGKSHPFRKTMADLKSRIYAKVSD
jgi:hypothetical protein